MRITAAEMSNMTRWLLVAVLLIVSLWSAKLTRYNWWAAGGPPTPYPHIYEQRANVFAIVTVLLFGSAGGLAVFNWKRRAR
jgi:hypothetical protein